MAVFSYFCVGFDLILHLFLSLSFVSIHLILTLYKTFVAHNSLSCAAVKELLTHCLPLP